MPYEKSSPASPEAQSGSPVQENLQALAALFPSVVRDGQVDVDALRQLCGEAVVKENELFGLNWRGKTEARRAALAPSLGTLRPCKEESKNWDTTQNLYIEGDNLEVLKLLRKSYGGKVKMIYIDPPYNTGREFVYPDDYQNGIENYKKLTGQVGKYSANVETSGRYHTDWLNMMYPRLVMARDLLNDDGVIFISIDDNEVDNLKKICNEVFGEQNFLECLIWKKRATPPNDRNIGRIHEFVLTYTKNIESVQLGLLPRDEASIVRYSNPDNDPRGPWVASDLSANGKGGRIVQSCIYPITNPLNGEQYLPSEGRCWLFNQEKMTAWISEGRIAFRENTGAPYLKRYLSEVRQGLTLPTIMTEFGFSQTSAAEGDLLFKKKGVFEYAKPTTLLTPLTRVGASAKDALILDFFSGSSTTADAVMQLNAEDGGKRRFIMVQLPEPTVEDSVAYKEGYKNVCEIGKERIRRAGEKAKEEAGLAGQNLDIGFRVYKLDSSNVKAWNPQEEDLVEAMSKYAEHLVGGRTEDDFLTEIMLKSGIDLVEEVQEREIAGHRVQSLGYGQYYACMSANMTTDEAEAVAIGIAAWHEEDCAFAGGEQQDTCTVFVSDRAFASNDAAKMNFVAILEQHGICNIKAL